MIRRLGSRVKMLLRRQKLGFQCGSVYHQIAWGYRARQLAREADARSAIRVGSIFEGKALCADQVIKAAGMTWARREWKAMVDADQAALFALITELAERSRDCTKKMPWKACFNREALDKFREAVQSPVWRYYESELNSVELPATGSHGDLTPENIKFDLDSSQLVIFDWESFDSHGSIIPDIGKLCLFIELRSHKKYSISELKKFPAIAKAADCLEANSTQLTLLGLLSLSLMERPWLSIATRAGKISL